MASPSPDPRELAGRIDALLTEVDSRAGSLARESAEELVRQLMLFYGAGLAQIVETVRAAAGPELVQRIAANPLVGGLLAVHDLHPVELSTRLRWAVDSARRRLGSHGKGIELTGVDGDGMVRIRMPAGRDADSARAVVEEAVADAAPDTAGVVFDAPRAEPVLVRIQPRPPAGISP